MSATDVRRRAAPAPLFAPSRSAFPEAELADLRRRINATRWPERETVADDSQGVPLATDAGARPLLGDRLRLARVRGEAERPAALHHRDRRARHPLHPRPLPARGRAAADRHARVARLDPRAAEDHRAAHQSRRRTARAPADAFHLVIPSLPGHGFSAKPTTTGWDPARTARAWVELMKRLGYTRFVAQGGDWGAAVTQTMGIQARAGAARHPLQHAGHRAGRDRRGVPARRPAAIRTVGRGAARVRPAERVLRQARGLRADHVDAPADAVRVRGLTDRSRGVRDRPRRRHRAARAHRGRSSTDACRATSRATTSSTTSRSTG